MRRGGFWETGLMRSELGFRCRGVRWVVYGFVLVCLERGAGWLIVDGGVCLVGDG